MFPLSIYEGKSPQGERLETTDITLQLNIMVWLSAQLSHLSECAPACGLACVHSATNAHITTNEVKNIWWETREFHAGTGEGLIIILPCLFIQGELYRSPRCYTSATSIFHLTAGVGPSRELRVHFVYLFVTLLHICQSDSMPMCSSAIYDWN